MTSEQFRALLQDLANAAGLADATSLLEYGAVNVGERAALLVHEPAYDPDLLQVRISLGEVPPAQEDAIATALLEANYVEGYGGECVFSLSPESLEAVVTMRLRLQSSLTAKDLWQSLSDIARHGSGIWDGIIANAVPSTGLQPVFGVRVA